MARSRFTQMAAGALAVGLAGAASPIFAQTFTLNYVSTQCVEETDWDGSASDEPYTIFAVARVNGFGSSILVERSPVRGHVDTGDIVHNTVTLWGFNDMAAAINLGQIIVLAAQMEHDESDPNQMVPLIQATMTANLLAYINAGLSFATIRSNLRRDLSNLVETTASATGVGNPDDDLGDALELVLSNTDLATGFTGRELRFRDSGQDATYDIRFDLIRN